jgi:hypothetical protein
MERSPATGITIVSTRVMPITARGIVPVWATAITRAGLIVPTPTTIRSAASDDMAM